MTGDRWLHTPGIGWRASLNRWNATKLLIKRKFILKSMFRELQVISCSMTGHRSNKYLKVSGTYKNILD